MSNLRVLPPANEPHGPLVEMLERLLERARTGEIFGAVVAFETPGRLEHEFQWSLQAIPAALIGEMNLAAFSIHLAMGRVHPPT